MLELFDYFRSTASYRVRIALNLKGLDYTATNIHLVNNGGEHNSDAYKALNPQGLVPALKTDNKILTQSMAILEYLEEEYSTPPLLPKDHLERAYIRSIANIVSCDIHPLNNLRVLQYLEKDLDVTLDQKNIWYANWIEKGFSAIESMLKDNESNGKFCVGSTPTIADLCLIPQIYNAQRFNINLKLFPTITSINTHCNSLSAFSKAAP